MQDSTNRFFIRFSYNWVICFIETHVEHKKNSLTNLLIYCSRHKFHFLFIGGALVALAVSRAVNIYPLSFLLNLGR